MCRGLSIVRAWLALTAILAPCTAVAQEVAGTSEMEPMVLPASAPVALHDDRILGVIPNYATVSDPHAPFVPLTIRQKLLLFAKSTGDPFNFVSAAISAGLSQADDGHPKYGQGKGAYAQRYGAAIGDMTSQNFFSAAVLGPLLHEDPRYFRRGPEYSIINRVAYSLSRIAITRKDSGRSCFNIAGIGGMSAGIALSTAYYPDGSISQSLILNRLATSITGAALGNLLPEFWPDMQRLGQKMVHRNKAAKPSN
jgi:hypothetical protein